MFGRIGLPELIVGTVVGTVMGVLVIWPAWRICRKAGYSGLLGIGLCVPLVSFVVSLYLAFAEWPIERELKQLKSSKGGI